MKQLLYTFILIFSACNTNAQFTLISSFDWDSNPVTTADVGPNGTVVSASAGSSPGGVGGTNGLNALASTPKRDIDLTIPGSPTFNVPGIDIWIDFQREESQGNFVTRGSSLSFGMNGGNLFCSYRVDNGAGGFNTVTSGAAYAIPNDDVFRTYRFFYNPANGIAQMQVNGVAVWTNDGPDNRNMYWTGAGNLVVGSLMDGNGVNETILDNLNIYSVTTSPLPVELLSFDGYKEGHSVRLTWSTASEVNNDYFTIEKSNDGINYTELSKIDGAGSTNFLSQYDTYDHQPEFGVNYYRLTQTDFDGTTSEPHFSVVTFDKGDATLTIYYQNGIPAAQLFSENTTTLFLFDISGKLVAQYSVEAGNTVIPLNNVPKGTYVVKLNSAIDPLAAKVVLN
jgi:hypothetical protein